MVGQLFCPDNSGYAEKRVQSYDFFSYLANFQALSFVFPPIFSFSLQLQPNFPTDFPLFTDFIRTF